MKIHLMSDLHLDHDDDADKAFLADLKPQPDIDLLVLAGDWFSICRPKETEELFTRLLDLYPDVLVVPGNHDYWNAGIDEAHAAMQPFKTHGPSGRLHVFTEPECKLIKGQRFLGGTLWYRRPPRRKLQDFIDMKQVQVGREWFFEQQRKLQELLYSKSTIGEQIDDLIVVTHHLPAPNSTPEIFKGSPADHFFMCNMTGAIMDRKPKMWLHGHTHDACDYVMGSTRIVCNPRGYPFEYKRRPPYEPKLIEV